MKKIAVFASGNGSNFQTIYDAIENGTLHAELACVICDKPQAYVIERAKLCGVPVHIYVPKDFANKAEYEQTVLSVLEGYSIDWLVLAGYMRLIGPTLLHAFEKRIVNIHPSLLPDFPGLHAIEQAMEARVKKTGITIHYVDEGMDTGEIIAQGELPIHEGESLESLEARIHELEHQLYPQVLERLLNS